MQHNQEKWEGIYPRSELTRLAGVTEEQSYNPAGHSEAEIVLVDDIAMQSTLPIKIIGNQPIPQTPALPAPGLMPERGEQEKRRMKRKTLLGAQKVKVMIGLLVGISLLLLASRFVNIPAAFQVLQQNLTTPKGIILALLSGVAFLLAYMVRGLRWKLFLNIVGNVSTFKVVRLFLVGVFVNFLLPVQGGEVAKSLMVRRTEGIAVNQSLPTIVMDKSFDLLPALFIIAVLPLLSISMDIKLWLVLGLVSGLLVTLILFVVLAVWKRTSAIYLLRKVTGLMPRSIGSKLEGFATGFVDSLLLAASRPGVFATALLLTCLAIGLDSLYAMLAFWTIDYPISYATVLFGYTVYNMFYILPNPPGQVGSNEVVGLLVFTGLLHIPPNKAIAMVVFAHPWTALLLCISGITCLSSLGLTISSAMRLQVEGEGAYPKGEEGKSF